MLRKGKTGSQVKHLQKTLNSLGYNAGSEDGIFGNLTENAVKNFQKDKGLLVDGIVGPKTEEKMQMKAQNKMLSKNFNEREFACKHCGNIKLNSDLVTKLQKLRDLVGRPITINSGYRCPTHNKNVGGSPGSKHMQGTAADIQVSGMSPKQVANAAEKVGFLGIGLYSTFTHVDLGPKRRW